MPADAPPAKRSKTNSGAAAASSSAASTRGTIARVKLHNFMSYRDAEIIDPGTRLNCIVGPNGTGKSSIVCAMCVGLGGPLKITGRGDKIQACVHGEGKTLDEKGVAITTGYVETEIVGGSDNGGNLTIRLDFDVANKKNWQMNGARCTEQKVKDTMKGLNIQVDNPLQFLPQDKVGEFSNMSPVELLKHTELAIGPETYEKHMKLISDDKELNTVRQRLGTEEKALESLESTNRALAQDVERFKKLQENKSKLDLYRGKLLWVEADYLQDKSEEEKGKLDTIKKDIKACKEKLAAAAGAAQPLEAAKKSISDKLKQVNNQMRAADLERCNCNEPLLAIEEEESKYLQEYETLDRKLAGKQKKVDDCTTQLADTEKRLAQARTEHATQEEGGDPEAQKAALMADVTRTNQEARAASEAHRDHRASEMQLRREMQDAQGKLNEIHSQQGKKMRLIVDKNKDAAKLAAYIHDGTRNTTIEKDEVIGPLLMAIDVPEKSHQALVEEAIGPKYAFSFLATTDRARNALMTKVKAEGWNVNIYKYPGGTFTPPKRPDAATMKKWGVTAWLDESVTIPPESRDAVLGALKDLTNISNYLLATPKTMGHIEQLQAYLSEQGVESVTILTPQRSYRVVRSKYGDRRLNATTQNMRPVSNLYSNSVDKEEEKRLQEEAKQRKAAHDAWLAQDATLDERASNAHDAKSDATTKLANFNSGRQGLIQLEQRAVVLRQRVETAQKEVDEFDVSARKSKLSKMLVEVAGKEAAINERMCRATAKIVSLRTEECALKLGVATATYQLAEAKEEKETREKELDEKNAEKADFTNKVKAMLEDCARKQAEARKAAPQLEKNKATGERSAEGQKAWDSMPGDLDSIEQEVNNLEEEINSSDDDGGETLRKYEQRLKDIEVAKQKVGDTQSEVADKQAQLDELREEWQPELHRLVSVVNDNFAAYFRRFRCTGEVALSDGRKLNPQTEQPEGPDDYSQYKILIRVQWRSNETLHVLGEGGRDSGGERSVATMVYLISLQNINPAPFRVVDEINQAMDSTNERNVFECITHACAEGGKQYFLLTPKLLPDLDYGEETAIQLVLNGPHNVPRDKFTLADFC